MVCTLWSSANANSALGKSWDRSSSTSHWRCFSVLSQKCCPRASTSPRHLLERYLYKDVEAFGKTEIMHADCETQCCSRMDMYQSYAWYHGFLQEKTVVAMVRPMATAALPEVTLKDGTEMTNCEEITTGGLLVTSMIHSTMRWTIFTFHKVRSSWLVT